MKLLALHDSDAVYAAWYDRGRRHLRVTFRARNGGEGDTYDYFDVSADVVGAFVAAPSHGQFINARIKPHYRVEPVVWARSPLQATALDRPETQRTRRKTKKPSRFREGFSYRSSCRGQFRSSQTWQRPTLPSLET